MFTFEPDLTTPAHLLVRVPYTSAELYLSRLNTAAQAGYLEEVESGKYRLTSKGRSELNSFIDEARDAMSNADPLKLSDATRLAELLNILVQSCLDTNPPPDTWSIRLSYKLLPSSDPPMPYIEQEFSCLAAYRDDAHLAAWQQSGLSATALETLTLLWRGDADSLNSLVKELAYRGHSLWIYADSLAVLRESGFVIGDDAGLTITQTGKDFRQQVESDTDRNFFAPWASMAQSEKIELSELLIDMKNGLKTGVDAD